MHSVGGGKSFAISSSGINTGFSSSSGGVNAALLVELVEDFDLDLVLLLLLLEDNVAVDNDDDVEDEPTIKLLPIDLLVVAIPDTLSDLDEDGIGCSIPGRKKHQFNKNKNKLMLNGLMVQVDRLSYQVHQQN